MGRAGATAIASKARIVIRVTIPRLVTRCGPEKILTFSVATLTGRSLGSTTDAGRTATVVPPTPTGQSVPSQARAAATSAWVPVSRVGWMTGANVGA